MKKSVLLYLSLAVVLVLAACAADPAPVPVDNNIAPAGELPDLTAFGLTAEDVTPEACDRINNDRNTASVCSVVFTLSEAISPERTLAYAERLYAVTAALADDGVNHSNVGETLAPVLGDADPAAQLTGDASEWFYVYNDVTYQVCVYQGLGAGDAYVNGLKLLIYTW